MPANSPEVIQLELKYCERCGGLKLRVRNSPAHYCLPCQRLIDEMAPDRHLRGRRNSPRPRMYAPHLGLVPPAAGGNGRLQ